MRKKWGMILGLTGMMILGSQGIYAAETAEAESTEPADDVEMKETDKDMENTVDIESRIKKRWLLCRGFRTRSVHHQG